MLDVSNGKESDTNRLQTSTRTELHHSLEKKKRKTTKTFERLREGYNGIVGLLDDQIEGENVQNNALGEQQLHFDLLE